MIIRIALLLIFASLAVFISADLLLWLAVPMLAGQMTKFGMAAMLSAFTLLLISGLCVILKLAKEACCDYFSTGQRLQRKLFFIQSQQDRFKRLFYFRRLQIYYFHEFKRKRLLMANDRQHILSLSKAIDKDLRSIKQQLSKPDYQKLHEKNVRYRDQQDSEALLKLQHSIAAIVYINFVRLNDDILQDGHSGMDSHQAFLPYVHQLDVNQFRADLCRNRFPARDGFRFTISYDNAQDSPWDWVSPSR